MRGDDDDRFTVSVESIRPANDNGRRRRPSPGRGALAGRVEQLVRDALVLSFDKRKRT